MHVMLMHHCASARTRLAALGAGTSHNSFAGLLVVFRGTG